MFIMASVCTLVFYGYYHDDQVVDVLSLMAVFTDNEQIRHFPSKSREFQKSFICRDRCCWPCWRNREEEQTSVAAFFFDFYSFLIIACLVFYRFHSSGLEDHFSSKKRAWYSRPSHYLSASA